MRHITILCVTFSLLLGINRNSHAQEAGNDADAIIDKAIRAHLGNGKNAMKKGYRGKNKGTLFINGLELAFTQDVATQSPDKFKEVMELTFQNNKIMTHTVFNGKEGWIKAADKDVPVTKDILEEFKDVASMMAISQGIFVKDKSLKLSVIGEVMVNGKPSIGVKITREGKKPIDMYFDKATGLMSKVERMKRDLMAGNEVTEERIIVEYQEIGGRKHPKRVEVKVDGKKFLEVEVLEAQFFDKLDDSEFARP